MKQTSKYINWLSQISENDINSDYSDDPVGRLKFVFMKPKDGYIKILAFR